jgi:hypothetical protein
MSPPTNADSDWITDVEPSDDGTVIISVPQTDGSTRKYRIPDQLLDPLPEEESVR